MHHVISLFTAGLLLFALTGTSSAQVQVSNMPARVGFDRADGRLAGATTARTGEVRDVARAAYRPRAAAGASVLESFSLEFLNRDHKIRRIGVLDAGRFASFAFADQDSNDPFRGDGAWRSVRGGTEGEVSGTSRGRAVVQLPPGPSGHVLVLRGFEVRREDGTDANVRTLGITLDGDARTATVVLSDDMGADWRGFETTLGIAALFAFLPPDGGTAVLGSAVDALSRLNNGFAPTEGQTPGRPYAFTVQYAWIPERVVDSQHASTGTEAREQRHTLERPTGPHALQGFLFSFGNSDHHLERVAINLGLAWSEPSHPASVPVPVYFKDNGRDDPMQWAVEYVTLRNL